MVAYEAERARAEQPGLVVELRGSQREGAAHMYGRDERGVRRVGDQVAGQPAQVELLLDWKGGGAASRDGQARSASTTSWRGREVVRRWLEAGEACCSS